MEIQYFLESYVTKKKKSNNRVCMVVYMDKLVVKIVDKKEDKLGFFLIHTKFSFKP